MLASDFLSDKNFMITVIKIVVKMCIMFIKGNILIPYTEILMRKVYLRGFFMSETSEKKHANQFSSESRTYFFHMNVRENKRFSSSFSASYRKSSQILKIIQSRNAVSFFSKVRVV